MVAKIGRPEQTVTINHEEAGQAIARVNERVNRSRQTESQLYNDTRRTAGVPGMPNDVKSSQRRSIIMRLQTRTTSRDRSDTLAGT
jgi:uncharacterized Zn finger protein (UPF0148 family)